MIETKRLILRPFKLEDTTYVYEYTNLQTVHCFLDMHFHRFDNALKEVEKRCNDDYSMAICLKETNEVIGEIFAYPESTSSSDINKDTFSPCWMLHPHYQRKGYLFEAATVYFDYLFNQKGARRIYTYTEDDNIACQKLCEKLGMRKEGLFKAFVTFTNNLDGTPLYENTIQYAILKNEWRENHESI